MAENVLPVTIYQAVASQQTFGMMGHRLGLRYEAAIGAINEYADEGYLMGVDRSQLRKRIMIVDRVVNKIMNDRAGEKGDSSE